jgi:hypothetical protein
MADYQDAMSDTPNSSFFSDLLKTGKEIYTSNRSTAAAEAAADANKANASATVLSSKNLMIAGVVVALAVVAFIMFRNK